MDIEWRDVVEAEILDGRVEDFCRRGIFGAVAAMSAFEVEEAGIPEVCVGDHADNFGAGDFEPANGGTFAARFKNLVQRRFIRVSEVHGNLCTVVGFDDPADGLAVFDLSRFFDADAVQ